MRRPIDGLRLAGVRREPGVVDLLHIGDDRQSEGRAVQPPLDAAAHVRRLAARHAQHFRQGCHLSGRADVPRQRLGHSLRRRDGRREAGVSRPGARRQVGVRTDGGGEGHAVRGRADRVAGSAELHGAERAAVLDDAAHDRGWCGVAAGDAAHLRGKIQRHRAACVGHDGNVAARHRLLACVPHHADLPREEHCTRSSASRDAPCSAST